MNLIPAFMFMFSWASAHRRWLFIKYKQYGPSRHDFKVFHHAARIVYYHNGQKQMVFVPYNKRKAAMTIGTKVYLVKGEHREDITQQPGTFYSINAKLLGGDYIEVLSHNQVKIFTGEEFPVV